MLGIETLTVNKFEEIVQRMRDDLAESGEARVSMDELSERTACKNAIRHATSDLKPKEYEKSFDGDSNEFVVTLVENEDAEDSADDSEDDEVEETEPDYDEGSENADDGDALPF